MRDDNNILFSISELNVHQNVVIIKSLCDYPLRAGMAVSSEISLLDYAVPGDHKHIVLIVELFYRHKGSYFFA